MFPANVNDFAKCYLYAKKAISMLPVFNDYLQNYSILIIQKKWIIHDNLVDYCDYGQKSLLLNPHTSSVITMDQGQGVLSLMLYVLILLYHTLSQQVCAPEDAKLSQI